MGNPAQTIARLGWETNAPGLQALALDGFIALGRGGETMAPTYAGAALELIDGSGVDQGDLSTTVGCGPKEINVRLANNIGELRLIASFLGKGATPTTPAGATLTREHILDREQTDIAFDDRITFDVGRDNGLFWSHRGLEINQLVFTIEGSQLVDAKAIVVWRHFTNFDDKVVEVPGSTPATEEFELSGLLNEANDALGAAADANKVTIQVTDITNIAASPIPSIVAKAEVGASPTFVGTHTFIIKGGIKADGEPRLNKVIDCVTGQPLGTCRLPVLLGVTDLTGYEVLDTTSWLQKATWAPFALGTAPIFNTACLTATIAGEERIINSATITLTQGKRPPGGGTWVGSGFPLTMTDEGKARHEITFGQDQRDTQIIKAITYGTVFDVELKMESGVFIDAGQPYDHRFVLDLKDVRAVADSEHKTTTSDTDVEETFTGVASGSPPARATIWTPITGIAAP